MVCHGVNSSVSFSRIFSTRIFAVFHEICAQGAALIQILLPVYPEASQIPRAHPLFFFYNFPTAFSSVGKIPAPSISITPQNIAFRITYAQFSQKVFHSLSNPVHILRAAAVVCPRSPRSIRLKLLEIPFFHSTQLFVSFSI